MAEEPKYEVVVLCAKPKEQKFVTEHFDKTFERLKHYKPVYKISNEPENLVNLLVMNCGEMGNISAASVTGHVLGWHKPNLVILVGTAGSLDPKKYNIGDVVIPELGAQTLSYNGIVDSEHIDFEKNRKRKLVADLWPNGIDGTEYALRQDTNKSNITLSRYSRDIISRASETTMDLPELTALLEKYEGNNDPKIHQDVHVFSWEKVVDSAKYRDKLNVQYSKTAAVDMESYGFLHAAKQYQDNLAVSAIIVRGISDLCGNKAIDFKDGYAVRNASIVAAEIVKRGYMNL